MKFSIQNLLMVCGVLSMFANSAKADSTMDVDTQRNLYLFRMTIWKAILEDRLEGELAQWCSFEAKNKTGNMKPCDQFTEQVNKANPEKAVLDGIPVVKGIIAEMEKSPQTDIRDENLVTLKAQLAELEKAPTPIYNMLKDK